MQVFKSAVLESVQMEGKSIYLTTSGEEVATSERKKKTGTEGSIWSQTFEKNFLHEGEWITDGRVLRAGVSIIPVIGTPTQVVTILNQFDSGHPTAAGKYTPPAGIWDNELPLIMAALKELGEEVILIQDGKVGNWSFNGKPLEEEWVTKFATENELGKSSFEVPVWQEEFVGGYEIFLNGVSQGMALVTAEFDTGGIELLFPVFTETRDLFEVRDGENFGGTWLHRNCDFFTKEEISAIPAEKRTTKIGVVEMLMEVVG